MKPLPLVFIAVIAVAQTPTPDVGARSREILDTALKSKNPDTRKEGVEALSLAADREPFISLLEGMLDDKDVPVRLTTIASLVDLKGERTVADLQKAMKDPVPEVSFTAAKALWGLKNAQGKQALLSVLSGTTKTSSGFFTTQKREALRMMHTPRTMMMFALKEGVGFAPIPGAGEGMASMQGLLSDPGVTGRAAAALLLGNEHDAATLKALHEALTDNDWSVRAAAVHSLALQNNPAFRPELEELLDDKKEAVRLRAAAACVRLEHVPVSKVKARSRTAVKRPQ